MGGDWFDFVENRDGAWLAIADAAGTGPTAAGLGASTLGALRAARRSGQDLEEALAGMDETIRRLDNPAFYLTALERAVRKRQLERLAVDEPPIGHPLMGDRACARSGRAPSPFRAGGA